MAPPVLGNLCQLAKYCILISHLRSNSMAFVGSTEYRKQPKTTEYYRKQPNTTENNRILPKTNLSKIQKTIKTTENYSILVPLNAGMHRKVPKYTDIDKIRTNMHS